MAGDIVTTRYIIETVFRASADPAIEQAARLAREAQQVNAQTTMASGSLSRLGASGGGLATVGATIGQIGTGLGTIGTAGEASTRRLVGSMAETARMAATVRREMAEPIFVRQIPAPSFAGAIAAPIATPITPVAIDGNATAAGMELTSILRSAAAAAALLVANLAPVGGAAGTVDLVAAAGQRATATMTGAAAAAGQMAAVPPSNLAAGLAGVPAVATAAEQAIRSAAAAPPVLVSAVDLVAPASTRATVSLAELMGTATVAAPSGWIAALPGDLGLVTSTSMAATSSLHQVEAAAAGLAQVPRITVAAGLTAIVPPAATARTTLGAVGSAAGQAAVQTGSIGRAAVQSAGQVATLPPAFERGESAARRFAGTSTSALDRVGSSAGGLMRQLVGIAGAYVGIHAIGGLIGGGVRDQMQMSSMIGGMATIIDSNTQNAKTGQRDFNNALALSRQYVRDIAKDSATLPGSFKDFAYAAAGLSGPSFSAGRDLVQQRKDLQDLAFAVPILGMTGITPQTVADQSAAILMGQAGIEKMTWSYLTTNTKALKGYRDSTLFNQLPVQQRADLFFKSIAEVSSNPDARKYIENSPAVIFSTLGDNLTGPIGVLGQTSSILMGSLVPAAKELNYWFAQNPDKVTAAAQAVAGPLVSGLKAGTDLLIYMADHADHIKMALLAGGAALATYKLGALLPSGAAAGATSGMQALGARVLLGAPILPAFSTATFAGALTAAAPAIVGFTALLVGVVAPIGGAIYVVTHNIAGLGSLFGNSMSALGGSLSSLGGSLGGLFIALAVPLGGVVVPLVTLLALGLNGLVIVITWTVNTIGGAVSGLATFIGVLSTDITNVSGAWKEAKQDFMTFDMANVPKRLEEQFKGPEVAEYTDRMKKQMADAAAKAGTNNYFNGDMHIHQEFEKGESPDRIAFGMMDEIKKMSRRMSRTPVVGVL